jgi:poly(rC)-binding protein 2/3/4
MITRLLVPSSKVGCILGQGSQDINEMRRLQAEIRVYPKNEKPKCASEDEELVQVMRLNAALHNQYLLLILMF